MSSQDNKNPNNVAGGFKATMHNPNASEEAKEGAAQRLHEMGSGGHDNASGGIKSSASRGGNMANSQSGHDIHSVNVQGAEDAGVDMSGKNPGNVIGGFKATLKNPNASEDAKQHASNVLDKMTN